MAENKTTKTTKTYKTTKTFKEAEDLYKNLQNVNPQDTDSTVALLVFKATQDATPVSVLFLENLTGLDLSQKDKLYDYYCKNLTIDDEFIAQTALFQLMEGLEPKTEEELLDNLKGLFAGLGNGQK